MLSTKSPTRNKQKDRVKTPTHILLFADSKVEAMELLKRQNKSLSGFLQEKLDELVQKSRKKEVAYMECPKYEQIIPLKPDADPYNYDYKLKAIPGTDDKAPISLSFSQRLRLKLDSV